MAEWKAQNGWKSKVTVKKEMSYTDIARKCRIDPPTAKRYTESTQRPEYTPTEPKPTKLDAYKQQVDSTLNRQFEDFAGFYGYKPVLCRPYRGQTKWKMGR